MAEPDSAWIDGVRTGRVLTYFNGANVGKWAGIVDLAAQAFNQIPDSIVTFKKVKDKASANVEVCVTKERSVDFEFEGKKQDPIVLGSLVHGRTRTVRRDQGIEKAKCVLPLETAESEKNHLIFIAAHELLHATGLAEHTNDGLLMSTPNMFNGKVFASADAKSMPPLFLGPKAASRMAAIW